MLRHSLLSLVMASAAPAQVHLSWPNTEGAYCVPGDLDGDGYDDVVHGDWKDVGEVRAISGRDGSVLWKVRGLSDAVDFGHYASGAGDVDGDGRPDVIVAGSGLYGSIFDPHVVVLSGADGALLHEHDQALGYLGLGISSCGLGDLDGDGRGEYAVGADSLWTSVCLVFSGATGQVVQRFPDAGVRVAAAGDLNGDGVGDLFLASYEALTARALPSGAVLFHKSFSGWVYDMATVGDMDHDGVPDAALALDQDGWMIVSGVDGQAILASPPGAPRIRSIIGMGDQDEDGVDDILASDWFPGPALLLSGANGAVLEERAHAVHLAPAGDVNRDGRPDFIYGSGETWTVTVESLGRIRYCAPAMPNSTGRRAELSALGSLRVTDGRLDLVARFLPPAQPVFFLASPHPRAAPGFGAGTLCVGSPTAVLAADPEISDDLGRAGVRLDLDQMPPLPPVQPGDALHVQGWYRDVGGVFNTTDALKLYFN